jgi:hypothetical protein
MLEHKFDQLFGINVGIFASQIGVKHINLTWGYLIIDQANQAG